MTRVSSPSVTARTASVQLGGPSSVTAAEAPKSRVWLLLEHGEHLRSVIVAEGQWLLVGRDPCAAVHLDAADISRRHAGLAFDAAGPWVEDLGSKNGVFVNGRAVSKKQLLRRGDVVTLGGARLEVVRMDLRDDDSPFATDLEQMRARIEHELLRARTFGRPFSLVAWRACADAAEAYWLRLRRGLRPVDSMALYKADVALLLLPELDASAARAWIEQWGRVVGFCGAAVASYPDMATTGGELWSSALDALARTSHSADALVIAAGESVAESLAEKVVLSPSMHRLYEVVARVAPTGIPVLLLGETGSGKESVASALHAHSGRTGPLRAINCGALTDSLLESTLFGHEAGAFSGAVSDQPGLFELANGGTLFLDEIAELSEAAQAALLRVLASQKVRRVGGRHELSVDVRIVAATNRDLAAMVEQGCFRADLWFRLDGVALQIPPLRERPEEIEALSDHFLVRARQRWNTQAKRVGPAARGALANYHWPGNVRQLRNVVERAAAVALGDEITLDDLPPEVAGLHEGSCELTVAHEEPTLQERMRAYETELIHRALERHAGNRSQAARALGVPRRTLAYRLRVLGLAG